MPKYRLLLCILPCFLAANTVAQSFKPASNPDKILAQLKSASQAAKSIQADFKEEKYLAVLKNPEQSSGLFCYKKDDRMRWEQQKPSKYVILINGDKLRVQEAGKEKNVASAGRMAAQLKDLLMGLVNGDFQQNKAFSHSCFESADQYQITLTPENKRLKKIYSKINLVFSKTTFRLKELTFLEKGGDKSVMTFTNERLNESIDESVFTSF